jgi:hypothetical protein
MRRRLEILLPREAGLAAAGGALCVGLVLAVALSMSPSPAAAGAQAKGTSSVSFIGITAQRLPDWEFDNAVRRPVATLQNLRSAGGSLVVQ